MKVFKVLMLFSLLISCSKEKPLNKIFQSVEGKAMSLASAMENNIGAVIFYLSPECPLCINYAPIIEEIKNSHSEVPLVFLGVVSGKYYTEGEIVRYTKEYGLELPVLLDPEFILSKHFEATHTPEVHLIDSTGEIRYSGAINNWAISLGQKRLRPTEHYLEDAINNYVKGEPIMPAKTKTVGCYIE